MAHKIAYARSFGGKRGCERQEGLPNPEAGRTAGYMYGMMFTVSDVRCLSV